jgi:hypothetical protein
VVVAASRNEFFIDPAIPIDCASMRPNASQAEDLTPSPHGVTLRTLKKSSDADAMNRVLQRNGSLNRSELEMQFLEAPEQKGAVPLEPTIVCRTVLGL